MLPLQLGTVEEFLIARDFLREHGYTEKAVCERLGMPAIDELVGKPEATWPEPGDRDGLGLVIGLFLFNQSFAAEKLESGFQPGAVPALRGLGLLVDDAAQPGSLKASMALYPAYGLYFVSDLWINVEGGPRGMITDLVFPAIGPNTRDFVRILPEDPCEDLLELCSGTGVAALLAASKYARHAWAVDITARAARAAEFNRRLNGIANVSVLEGDLYAPLEGRRFDRIVAHPPYVPSLKPDKIYCDGGTDGLRITRSIIGGLVSHLKPGGRFYCLTMGMERDGHPFEQQVREWLGGGTSDFDVLFAMVKAHTPAEFAHQATISERGDRKLVRKWIDHLQDLGIRRLALGTIAIRRNDDGRLGVTLRRDHGTASGPAELEWLMRWESAPARHQDVQWMLAARPAFSPEAELRVHHRFKHAAMVPARFVLETSYPFSTECQVEEWMAIMLAQCDGKRTVAEIFEACRQNKLIHPEAPVGEFVELLRSLISGGILLVEGFYPPKFSTEQPEKISAGR